MTFIYELDQYPLEIYRICKNELPTSFKSYRVACECVHLVTPDHFRSRDKDSSHAIGSTIVEKNHDIRKPRGCICYRTGVNDRSKFYICSRDLDLDPMTFVYELDPYSLEIYRMCKYELLA